MDNIDRAINGGLDLSTPESRPVPVAWTSAPLDMQQVGFKGMMIMHMPVRKEWGEADRARISQLAADAALRVIREEERR